MLHEEVMGPLLTLKVHEALLAAAHAGAPAVECSLDLDRSTTTVEVGVAGWIWQGQTIPVSGSLQGQNHLPLGGREPFSRWRASRRH